MAGNANTLFGWNVLFGGKYYLMEMYYFAEIYYLVEMYYFAEIYYSAEKYYLVEMHYFTKMYYFAENYYLVEIELFVLLEWSESEEKMRWRSTADVKTIHFHSLPFVKLTNGRAVQRAEIELKKKLTAIKKRLQKLEKTN